MRTFSSYVALVAAVHGFSYTRRNANGFTMIVMAGCICSPME